MQLNGSHIEGTNVSHGEEAFTPLSQEADSLVVLEYVFVFIYISWLHRLKPPSDVSSEVEFTVDWRVIAMVIARTKIDYCVNHLLATTNSPVNQLLCEAIIVPLHAEQEFIKTVVLSLDCSFHFIF